MPIYPRDANHIVLQGKAVAEPFAGRGGGKSKSLTPRDRAAHAATLRAAIQAALREAQARRVSRNPDAASGEPGFYLEIEVPPERRAALDSLGNLRKGVELVAVREPTDGEGPIIAAVFVPDDAASYYLEKIDAYADEPVGNARPKNQALVEAIEDIRIAEVATVFTDAPDRFPNEDRALWWEVWLRRGTLDNFTQTATALSIEVRGHAVLTFREREVVLAYGRPSQLGEVLSHSDAVAEIRLAAETPHTLLRMNGAEQQLWSDNLLQRVVQPATDAPAVCLLDTGANRSHALISVALHENDTHTYNPNWSLADTRRHATRMAGLALYGDLSVALQGSGPLPLLHRLESVKIIPPEDAPPHEKELFGWVTQEGVARAEIAATNRRRTIALSVTGDEQGLGRPSQWSAKIDDLAFDPSHRRLFFVAAGNIRGDVTRAEYLNRNDVSPIEDPAQAWNALTIGAITDRVNITEADLAHYEPFAEAGDLCPTSRTSLVWGSGWPIKPDVVFEGGNLASDGGGLGEALDDLQALTTHASPMLRPFDTFGETSAATALAASMGASIIAARPDLWEESVRALIVHSAEWNARMLAHVEDKSRKGDWRLALRRYGFGVPDLAGALKSARNDITLIAQDDLQPFHKPKHSRKNPDKPNSSVLMNEMNLHALPWPRDELLDLQDAEARCRITLSYFIEPNPGERGWTRKHRYASHGLRFAFKTAEETIDEFRARINAAIEGEDDALSETNGGGEHWLLGTRQRNVGSLHADIWTGTAAELATRDAVAVYPVGGWWKEKPYLQRFESKARYALVVSLSVPSATIDIRNLIAVEVGVPVMIETAI